MPRKKEINVVLNKLKSDEGYNILDASKAANTTFQEGGCWIFAEALSKYYDLPIYVIYNIFKRRVEHFFVKLNNMFLDSDGIQSSVEMLKKISEDGFYNINDLIIVKFNDKLNTSDIIRDNDASNNLLKLIENIYVK
jgi:hypothetical protein